MEGSNGGGMYCMKVIKLIGEGKKGGRMGGVGKRKCEKKYDIISWNLEA